MKIQTYMEKEIMEQPEVLERCVVKNAEVIAAIKDELEYKPIDVIVIAARGSSDHTAVYGKYAIESISGIPAVLAAPSISTMYNMPYRLKNALVIGVSQSGEAADVANILSDAKNSGISTIAITNTESSRLHKIAKYHLGCYAGEEKSVAATKTFSAELLIWAQLANIFMKRSLTNEIMHIAESVRKVLDMKCEFFEKAIRYRFMEDCLTLSRGYSYCIALESALKMQECAYVKAKAYSFSDFMHGPIALVTEGTPCFLFCDSKRFAQEYLEVTHRLNDYGADITVFSDKQFRDYVDVSFLLPPVEEEILKPIIYACAAQLFACGLAISKKTDPDKPRNIKKITITK